MIARNAQINASRNFLLGPPNNPVRSYNSRGSARRALKESLSGEFMAESIPHFYVTEQYRLRLDLGAVADDDHARVG